MIPSWVHLQINTIIHVLQNNRDRFILAYKLFTYALALCSKRLTLYWVNILKILNSILYFFTISLFSSPTLSEHKYVICMSLFVGTAVGLIIYAL